MSRSFKLTYCTAPMRRLMTPWLHALKKMGNVFVVLIFILYLFAAIGVMEFRGNRYFRCRKTPEPIGDLWEIDESIDRLCNAYGYGTFNCPASTYCGTPDEYNLPITSQEDVGSELVFYGAVGFENIIKSFLACFQVITYDDWAKIMYRMQDSNSSVLSRIMFPLLVFIGSFFGLNLIVAVVVDTFQTYRAELIEKESKNNLARSLSINSSMADSHIELQSPDRKSVV